MDALEDNVIILRRLGLFEVTGEGRQKWIVSMKNLFVKAVISYNVFVSAIGMPMYIYKNSHNMSNVFISLNNTLAVHQTNVAILVILLQNKALRILVDSLRDMSKYHSTFDSKTIEILNYTKKVCHLLTISLPKIVFILYFIAFYGVVIHASQQSKEEIDDLIMVWLPFDLYAPYVFEAYVIFFVSVISFVVIVMVVNTSLATSIMQHILAQFRILNHNLENLRELAISNVEKRLDVTVQELRQDLGVHNGGGEPFPGGCIDVEMAHLEGNIARCDTPMANLEQDRVAQAEAFNNILLMERKRRLVSEEMERILEKCIAHHCDIIRFIEKFESFYNSLFCTIVVANLTINVCIMVSPSMLSDSVTIALFAPRLLNFLIQLLLYCYCAEKVTEESGYVKTSISASDWTECSDSFKKSMLVVIAMANKPIVIKAAGFVPMSAETIRNVVNTAFSYYTVLREFTQTKAND